MIKNCHVIKLTYKFKYKSVVEIEKPIAKIYITHLGMVVSTCLYYQH